MNSPKVNEKPAKGQMTKKPSTLMSPSDSQEQIDDDESTPAQILERVKPDRAATTKQDEDRRRRTIIVEKRNGSYGFTLQSYGIHYKKEQEIEMITYVDYVEYDGPAYKAGMREGDVILSINGHDMEKADHKTLVNFIKNCDTRMRMVVLFEDCVRKVELHIRYIQLQRILQSKTAELDRLCLKERELLQGKWKSQSLPARKKGNSSTQSELVSPCQEEPSCRPTVSTEDVARVPNQTQLLLAYHYLDPRYQYVLRSEGNSSEFLVDWSQGSRDSKPILVKSNHEAKSKRSIPKGYHQTNGVASTDAMKNRSNKSKHHHHSRHLCNPCMQAINNQDNNSLEAYDLASPCCDPHCVPSARRKSKHSKHKHGHHSSGHDHESSKENIKCSASKEKSQDGGQGVQKSSHHRSHKYFSFGSNLVSQFSLHSCTSSDVSNSAAVGESSGVSYTTSLSSDTLYWDGNDSKAQSAKPHSYSRSSSYKNPQTSESYQSYNPVKPKSWDNLTTKAFGGYGFGYGYVDAGSSYRNQPNSGTCNVSNTMPAKMKSHSKANGMKVNLNQINFKSQAGGRVHSIQIYHNGHHHYVQPTKSSENLLQKHDSGLANSSLSCECLEIGSPAGEAAIKQFFPFRSGEILYCHQDKASQTDVKQRRSSGETQPGTVSRL